MNITWKLARKHGLTPACPCYDPIVFGHLLPCPRWESPPRPAPHAADFMQFTVAGIAQIAQIAGPADGPGQATQRFRRVAEQLYALMQDTRLAGSYQAELLDTPYTQPGLPSATPMSPQPQTRNDERPRDGT